MTAYLEMEKALRQLVEKTDRAVSIKYSGASLTGADWIELDRLSREARVLLNSGLKRDEPNPGFDPDQCFDSVKEAISVIGKCPNVRKALIETVEANIENGEFGFASELVYDAEQILTEPLAEISDDLWPEGVEADALPSESAPKLKSK
jgi:hypothetical protein